MAATGRSVADRTRAKPRVRTIWGVRLRLWKSRARRGGLLAAVAVGALVAGGGAASAAAWWRLPVWGAEVRAFAVDPFEASTIYCGTSRGNFYRSSDGGASWEPLRQGPAFPGH